MSFKNDTINITDLKEVRHKPPRKGGKPSEKKGFFKSRAWVFLRTLLAAGVVLMLTYYVYSNAEELNPENIRRIVTKLDTASLEDTDIIDFIGGSDDKFAAFREGLVVVSTGGVSYYNKKGIEELSLQRPFTRPALSAGDKMFLAYDRGGTSLVAANTYRTLLDLRFEAPISNARMGPEGQFAVILEQEGYRARVAAYNTAHQEIYRWDSATYYCMDAALSQDCNTLAVAAFTEGGTGIVSSVVLFDTNKNGIQATVPLGESLALAVFFMGRDRLCVVSDTACVIFDPKGVELFRFSFDGAQLAAFDTGGDGYVTLLLNENLGGSRHVLYTLDKEGEIRARQAVNGEVERISAAGNHVAALCGDQLLLYDEALVRREVLDLKEHVHKVIAKPDGSVILISGSSARIIQR